MYMIILPKIKIEIERWKFNDKYNIYVSNLGNFKTKQKEDIQLKIDKSGYLVIPICNNKKGIIRYIFAHRVVMETWRPRADMWKKKLTVDHLDHNKRNNAYKNLEWVTELENKRRANEDFLFDDKDKIIQSLQDKIKELLRDKKIIILDTGMVFYNWDDVIKFLIKQKKITRKDFIKENVIKRIRKASRNQTAYCHYKWKVD